MSACMSGTRGSGVLFSTGDMLVRDVGRVCDMCMCLARGGVGGRGGQGECWTCVCVLVAVVWVVQVGSG